MTQPRVLIAGTADEVIDALLEMSRRREIDTWDASIAPPPPDWRGHVLIAVVRHDRHASAISAGVSLLKSLAEHAAKDATQLIVEVGGAAKIARGAPLRWLSDELLHQVERAIRIVPNVTVQRNIRSTVGLAMLNALGVHVLRLGRIA